MSHSCPKCGSAMSSRQRTKRGKKTVTHDCLTCMLNRNKSRRDQDPYVFFASTWRNEVKVKAKRGITIDPPTITREQFQLLQSQQHCWCCGDRFSKRVHNKQRTIDRLIPARGYRFDNCAALCLECNRRKNDSSLEKLKQIASWLEEQLSARSDGTWQPPAPRPVAPESLAVFKWIWGPSGPMICVLAETKKQARQLAIARLREMDPDDDPEHPQSWFNESDCEVIELDKSRVICTA